MAESYVTGERFGKGELFREAVKAIASGTHVVVPAADAGPGRGELLLKTLAEQEYRTEAEGLSYGEFAMRNELIRLARELRAAQQRAKP